MCYRSTRSLYLRCGKKWAKINNYASENVFKFYYQFKGEGSPEPFLHLIKDYTVHYKNGKFYKSINFGKNKNSYIVKKVRENIVEDELDKINLK